MSDWELRPDAIYIVGIGAQTPVGRSVAAAAAAVRCGISAYAEHESLLDKYSEPMVLARADWFAGMPTATERILTLAVDAAQEALAPLGGPTPGRPDIRIHLALSDKTVRERSERKKIEGGLRKALRVDGEINAVMQGHAGGLLALENAANDLRTGNAELCLVGGADSWLEPERLKALDMQGRLHSTHNSWGFTPGEGAGFCLLARGTAVEHYGISPLAELVAVGTARETKVMGSSTVCLGEGLTEAFRKVFQPRLKVAHAYCDFNGETYRAEEYGFAVCRTSQCFEDAGSFTAGAECWGDVGSASALLGVALATCAWIKGNARGPAALVWASSASEPLRGAAVLQQFGEKG